MAAQAKAKLTLMPTYPVYRIGGWIAIAKSCSSGFRSFPSTGGRNETLEGLEVESKNSMKPKLTTPRRRAFQLGPAAVLSHLRVVGVRTKGSLLLWTAAGLVDVAVALLPIICQRLRRARARRPGRRQFRLHAVFALHLEPLRAFSFRPPWTGTI